MSFIAIYVTNPTEAVARKIANFLLEQKLVACANIYQMNSLYWWKENVQDEKEWVSLLKSTPELWSKIKKKIEEVHPYEVPCVMKFEVEANEGYEKWIRDSVVPVDEF